jgi:hypothetical protein
MVALQNGVLAARRYGHGKRFFYGMLWLAWSALGLIGGVALLGQGQAAAGLFGLAFGAVAGIYDYRIWTWQARRLWFLIIF